ncbi:MAG: Gfo/Idh/MocA family oxidoreductase, partial [Pirellulales bacterium]|nr:Gfo/Idh/MocA family oxidoreductase [Pirellulales bacterium]
MPIRWGIIGCGDVARRRVAAAILGDEHSDCLAACRRDPAQLAQFCSDFEIPRAYTTHQELLADEQ